MYANAETFPSLPEVLASRPPASPGRRHQVGPCCINPRGLDRFNELLAGLGQAVPLACDQIVTAARLLEDEPGAAFAPPPCIRLRLAGAEPLARLAVDEGWQAAGAPLQDVQAVLHYLLSPDDLIPDWVPRVGRLDDAIVIDRAWPRIGEEVAGYLDFCRLRQLEAGLRGERPGRFRFTRDEWRVSRQAEAELRAHQRAVRAGSYLPAGASRFRVH